jgi:hypothetical protein
VAVNKAGPKPQDTPDREATGNISSNVPNKMIPANTTEIICVALMCLRFFSAKR